MSNRLMSIVVRGSVRGSGRGAARGLTFVEILVATLLLAMVFAIGWTISSAFLGVRKVRDYEVAVALATQAIEAVRAARHRELGSDKDGRKDTLLADFSSAGQPFDDEAGEGFVPVVKVGAVEFKREIFISDAPSLLEPLPSGLKVIRVVISWKAVEDGAPVVFEAVTAHADLW